MRVNSEMSLDEKLITQLLFCLPKPMTTSVYDSYISLHIHHLASHCCRSCECTIAPLRYTIAASIDQINCAHIPPAAVAIIEHVLFGVFRNATSLIAHLDKDEIYVSTF